MSCGIVTLDRVHRFKGGIARLSEAIRHGKADEAVKILNEAPEGIEWIASDAESASRLMSAAGADCERDAAQRRTRLSARPTAEYFIL